MKTGTQLLVAQRPKQAAKSLWCDRLRQAYRPLEVQTVDACRDWLNLQPAAGVVIGDPLSEETFRWVRAIKADHPSLPIMLVTEQPSFELHCQALLAGAAGYLVRPMSAELFAEFVDAAISTWSSQRTGFLTALDETGSFAQGGGKRNDNLSIAT